LLLGVLVWPTAPAFYSVAGSTGQFSISVADVLGDFLAKPGRRRKPAGLRFRGKLDFDDLEPRTLTFVDVQFRVKPAGDRNLVTPLEDSAALS
jgi:hypothetical protein